MTKVPGVDYTQDISASMGLPTAVVFLVDQSGSMADPWPGGKGSKADEAADCINKAIDELILSGQKGEAMRDYFEILAITYSGNGAKDPWGSGFLPISALKSMARTETRQVEVYMGAGQNQLRDTVFNVWFDSDANGGTPMGDAFNLAERQLTDWISRHPDSFPPIVFNITDAQPSDQKGSLDAARRLAQLRTNDGAVLMAGFHISETAGQPMLFPSSPVGLPDEFAKFLFDIASPLPPKMLAEAKKRMEGAVSDGARIYMFGGGPAQFVALLDIGTKTQKEQQVDR